MHCLKFLHSILDMESQMNGIAVIIFSFIHFIFNVRNMVYPF